MAQAKLVPDTDTDDPRIDSTIIYTVVRVIPPYVEHEWGWRARQLRIEAVVDLVPPIIDYGNDSDLLLPSPDFLPPLTDNQRQLFQAIIRDWVRDCARRLGVPLVTAYVASREWPLQP